MKYCKFSDRCKKRWFEEYAKKHKGFCIYEVNNEPEHCPKYKKYTKEDMNKSQNSD